MASIKFWHGVSVGALGLTLATMALPAAAKIICCNSASGQRVCGDPAPSECTGRAYKEIGSGGSAKSYDAAQTAEERQALERKARDEREAAIKRRQKTSLLSSYASEQEIITARDVELRRIDAVRAELQAKIEEENNKVQMLHAQIASTSDAAGKESLQAQQAAAELNIRKQKKLLAERDDEAGRVKTQYADTVKRYRELSESGAGGGKQ